jgi:hypothetical protein
MSIVREVWQEWSGYGLKLSAIVAWLHAAVPSPLLSALQATLFLLRQASLQA